MAIGAGKTRALVDQWMNSENLERWREASTGKPTRKPGQLKKVLSCNRRTLSWLTALITGHGVFRYHLSKMKIVEEDTYMLCKYAAVKHSLASGCGHRYGTEHFCDLSLKNMLDITMRSMDHWELDDHLSKRQKGTRNQRSESNISPQTILLLLKSKVTRFSNFSKEENHIQNGDGESE